MRTINNITLINSTLEQEVTNLSEKLKSIENESNIEDLKRKIDELESTNKFQNQSYTENMFDKNKKIEDLEWTIKQSYRINEIYEQDQHMLQFKLDNQSIKLNAFLKDKEVLNNKLSQMREIQQMQFEEIQAKNMKNLEDKKLINTIQDKFQHMKYKIDKMQVDRTKEIDIPEYREYKEQLINLTKLVSQFDQDPVYFAMKPRKDEMEQQKISSSTQIIDAEPDLQLNYQFYQRLQDHNFQYQLPSYMVFIEHHNKTFLNEIQVIQFRKIHPQFLILVRYIMDSYWNNIILNQDNLQKVPRMAEFTYHWIHSFIIDPITRRIQQMSQTEKMSNGDNYIRFIQDLHSPDLLKVWEIQQFKKLLEDRYTKDEEYFFFYYRFVVFRGQMMHRDNPQCTTQFIPLVYGEFVIGMVMNKYDNKSIQQAKNSLQKYKKIVRRSKEDIYLVNGWWVMAIIMEFFETEKKYRFSWIKQQFARAQGLLKPSKKGVSFLMFCKIMKSMFPNSSPLVTAQLYRESYALNAALGVTPQSFMVAATESHFLTRQLSIFSCSHFTLISQDEINNQKRTEHLEFKYLFKSHLQEFETVDDHLRDQFNQLGCTEVIDDLNDFKSIFNSTQKKFTTINITFELQRILNMLVKVKHLKQFHQILFNINDPCSVFIDQINKFSKNLADNAESNSILFKSYGNQSFTSMSEIKNYVNDIKLVADSFNLFSSITQVNIELKTNKVSKLQRSIRRHLIKFYYKIRRALFLKIKTAQIQQITSIPQVKQQTKVKKSVLFNSALIQRVSAQLSRKRSTQTTITPRKSQFEKKN